jgi:hypothetical protein
MQIHAIAVMPKSVDLLLKRFLLHLELLKMKEKNIKTTTYKTNNFVGGKDLVKYVSDLITEDDKRRNREMFNSTDVDNR